jgi:hypothetical protein
MMETPRPDDMPAEGPMLLDDRELSKIHFSPVCSYCAHWQPEYERHCAAFPEGKGQKHIPDRVWYGQAFHVEPVGGEQVDARGKPITFQPGRRVNRSPDNAALLDAYNEVHPRSRRWRS